MRRRETGKTIDVEPFLGDLRSYLESLDGLVAAWIYGSYRTQYQTPLSDLNLAFLYQRDSLPDLAEEGRLWLRSADILHEEDVSVEIVNRLSILRQFRVIKEGRRLVCRAPIALADFVEWVLSRHADYIIHHQEFAAEYDQALVERYGSETKERRS
ncbi:MAG TPA: nucleotidyltransferase domain-containing protein [Thermoanaerobaculia bacterium]|nr:nucleotidyltransferase domain-containing protein [Thermoanaerobaculia bacterium]